MKMADWPDCATAGCNNGACTWANTPLCYTCAVAVHGQYVMEFLYDATHDGEGLIPEIDGITYSE